MSLRRTSKQVAVLDRLQGIPSVQLVLGATVSFYGTDGLDFPLPSFGFPLPLPPSGGRRVNFELNERWRRRRRQHVGLTLLAGDLEMVRWSNGDKVSRHVKRAVRERHGFTLMIPTE